MKRICQDERARGIETIVDGAHAFAQFPFKQADLDCDYYGTSLHKWVLAPIGTGMLYVRKNKDPVDLADDGRAGFDAGQHPEIRKRLARIQPRKENAITEAINFHESIGAERKAERFRYLRKRWSKSVARTAGREDSQQ